MLDFERCDEQQLALVREVVEELAALGTIDTRDTMIVGASCRDLLHSATGHGFPLRRTHDVDIAIALPGWAPFHELTSQLTPIGSTGIRYLVRSIPVDLVPFGDVEDPAGTVTPRRHKEDMSVFAFREVFEHVLDLPLGDALTIRILTPAGFCALKMSAWVNRSVDGDTRDGPDIATIVYWYAESGTISHRLYAGDDTDILVAADMDVLLASATVLGRDLAGEIGPHRVRELESRWSMSASHRLAREFGHDTIPGWPTNLERRDAVIEALGSGIWSRA